MNNLPKWQRPIVWALIILAFPFVMLWRVYVSAKWTIWAGKLFLPHGRR